MPREKSRSAGEIPASASLHEHGLATCSNSEVDVPGISESETLNQGFKSSSNSLFDRVLRVARGLMRGFTGKRCGVTGYTGGLHLLTRTLQATGRIIQQTRSQASLQHLEMELDFR